MVPLGNTGIMNNRKLNGLGQQAFGPGVGRTLPNNQFQGHQQQAYGPGAGRMIPNNQFQGSQQPMELGVYKGPALNRAGRR